MGGHWPGKRVAKWEENERTKEMGKGMGKRLKKREGKEVLGRKGKGRQKGRKGERVRKRKVSTVSKQNRTFV